MSTRIKRFNRFIVTRNPDGYINGYVVPIWNARTEPEERPEQVYVTAVSPYYHKGPHLHHKRRGVFTCIKGDAVIVTRENGVYIEHMTGENSNYATVIVPPGVPAAIYNKREETAIILNLPSPSWSPDDTDEYPVENWSYTP